MHVHIASQQLHRNNCKPASHIFLKYIPNYQFCIKDDRERACIAAHEQAARKKKTPGNMISTLPFFTKLHLSSSDLWQPESSLPDLLKSSLACCHVKVRREKWSRRGRWWGGRCCKGGEASTAGTIFHFTGCKVSLSTLWGIHRNWVTFYQNF